MSQMELTYRSVLEHLVYQTEDDESQKELCHNFRSLMRSIIVLAKSLSKKSLTTLLEMSIQSIGQQIALLHLILQISVN